jgi:hypothetical protein
MDSGVREGAGRELSMPNYVQKRGATQRVAYASSRASASAKAKGNATRSKARKSGGGKRKRRKQRPTARTWFVAAALVVFAVLLGVLFGGGKEETLSSLTESNVEIYEGVYIENTYMGGKTAKEARAQLEELAREKLARASLSLVTPNGIFSLNAEEIGLSAKVDEVLEQALSCGRSGSLLENARERSELKSAGKNFELAFGVQQAALLAAVQDMKAQADSAPVEPYAIPSLSEDLVQSFAFYEGKSGYAVDAQATAKLVTEAIERGELDAQIEPVFTATAPTMTLEFIKENTKRISTYTTRFKKGGSEVVENRVYNIRKTADILNCQTVMPSETFSYNDTVGPRTVEGGWKEANGISNGKEYTLQAGGGVCQTSTTLYNALLCGNIEVTERRKHSIPSDYVPKGLDATVDTSGIDLKFFNDTGAPIYMFVYIKPDPTDSSYLTITVSLYGKPLPEGVTYQPRSEVTETIVQSEVIYTDDPAIPLGYELVAVKPHDGFVADAYLDKYVNGVLESSEFLYTDKYRGNAAEVRRGTGDPLILSVPEGATPVAPQSGASPNSTPQPNG